MAEVDDLSGTDASNTGRFPENQAPSTVNNGARALEGMLARFFKDTVQPTKTSGGSANAQTLTPNRTIATLASPMAFLWKAGFTNTGPMTLNVSDTAATGAKSVKVADGAGGFADPAAGAVSLGSIYHSVYDGTRHILLNPTIGAVAWGGITGSIASQSDLVNTRVAAIEYVIDGGGATITTGVKGYLEIPFACTINRSTLLADQSGSIVVNIWKTTYSAFDAGSTHPVVGDKITASAPPTLSTATKAQDSTLTGWTTSISAGDILAFNVDSVTTCQRVTLSLKVTKS